MRLAPGLLVSFQRYAAPAGGVVDRAPLSVGALPVALGAAGERLLPVADEECFWIGLSVEPGSPPLAVSLRVELRGGRSVDALSGADWDAARARTAIVPDTPRVDGVRRPDARFDVLTRRARAAQLACERLRLRVATAPADEAAEIAPATWREVSLRLVDPPTFEAESGVAAPAPLDEKAGYGGWLLP